MQATLRRNPTPTQGHGVSDEELAAIGRALGLPERDTRAAASTVEALVYSLRRGVKALTSADSQYDRTRARLGELSREQLNEVVRRVLHFKPNITPAWTEAEVKALICAWEPAQ